MIEDASHYIDYIKNQREMCKCAHTLLLHPQGAPLHSDNTWRNDEMSSDSKQCSDSWKMYVKSTGLYEYLSLSNENLRCSRFEGSAPNIDSA
jgi:hypothetical protein